MEDLDPTKMFAGVLGAAALLMYLTRRGPAEPAKDPEEVAKSLLESEQPATTSKASKKKKKKAKAAAAKAAAPAKKAAPAAPVVKEQPKPAAAPAPAATQEKVLSKSQKKRMAKKAAAERAAAEEAEAAKKAAATKSKKKKSKANGSAKVNATPVAIETPPKVQEPVATPEQDSEDGWSVVEKKRPAKKKTQKKNTEAGETSAVPSTTIEITPRELSIVIGQGGKNIQQIQLESGASLNVAKDQTGDKRTCVITGSPSEVALAQELIQEYIENGGPKPEASSSFTVSDRDAGLIIGKGGVTIRQLQNDNNVRITCDKLEGGVARVTVSGDNDNVPKGVNAIRAFVAANNVSKTILLESDRIIQAVFGPSGARKMQIQNETDARVDISKVARTVTLLGTQVQVSKAEAMVLETIAIEKGPPRVSGGDIYERIEIGGATGQIVGSGGKTIQGIQERSGAKVDIKDDNTCYVIGKPDAVAAASKEVNDIVAKYQENIAKVEATRVAYTASATGEWDVPPLEGAWAIGVVPHDAGVDGWGNPDLGAAQGW